MAPEAAKRLGAGGPSPGPCPPAWPGRKAFCLRRDGVLRIHILFMASAMPSFQFLVKSSKSMLTAVI